MADVLHVVIHQVYSDVKLLHLEDCCERILIGQHDADESISRTHCHVMLVKCSITHEAIRKRIASAGFGGRGNYSILTTARDEDKLGIYILKGDRRIAQQFSYTEEQILKWVAQWISYPPATKKNSKPNQNSESKNSQTHCEIMSAILAETRALEGIWERINRIVTDDDGRMMEEEWVCKNRRLVFNVMLKHLAKNHVRTSKHELERFWVTMMRDEQVTKAALYETLMKKIYEV